MTLAQLTAEIESLFGVVLDGYQVYQPYGEDGRIVFYIKEKK